MLEQSDAEFNIGKRDGFSWRVSTSSRTSRRRLVARDRHGRGARGPLVRKNLPMYRSRRDRFDELVIGAARYLIAHMPALKDIEYAVEDVPPSDPAPWEQHSVVLARAFPAENSSHLQARIVVYRKPCEQRAQDAQELYYLVHAVVIEQAAQLMGRRPDEIDPNWLA
ncbi:MAG: metallopeptidase family protein [Actinomycetaceae bacterium]|nr:metallopeptidase family protein [Actinomycetaceae bacterium]